MPRKITFKGLLFHFVEQLFGKEYIQKCEKIQKIVAKSFEMVYNDITNDIWCISPPKNKDEQAEYVQGCTRLMK